MKLTDKQYRDAIDWVVTAQRGRFPIERGHIDAIADILLSLKEKAAGEMFDALENCAELLNVAMERLGVCGEGDSGQRRADAEFPGGVAALHAARAALAKAGQP